MKKDTKAITNQATPEELEAKIKAIDEPEEETVIKDPVTTPPETATETPESEELDLEEVKSKDPNELTDEEQTFLEENKDKLSDDEKVAFNIEEPVEPSEKPATPTEDKTDWKARYAGSTREAQVLAARNKQITETIAKAGELGEPSDDEMAKEMGEEWEIMDEVQKKLARQALLAKKQFNMIHEATMQVKKIDEWMDNVRKYAGDPQVLLKFPQLEGKELEFAQFCAIPSRVGVELEDLVKAFTFDIKEEIPQRKTLFERGTGGEAIKPKELTVEEISFIRSHDQKRYKQLISSGKIKIEI